MTQIPLQSRFKQDFTRIRTAGGSYVDGRYVEGTLTATDFQGSVQPFIDRGSETLQRLAEGDRTKKIIVIYTYPDTLKTVDEKNNKKADIVVYEGETYEVQKVNRWKGQILTHDEVWGVETDAGVLVPGVGFDAVIETETDNQSNDSVVSVYVAAAVETENAVQSNDSVGDFVNVIVPAPVSYTINESGRQLDIVWSTTLVDGSTTGITLTGTVIESSSFTGNTQTLVIRQVFSTATGGSATIQYTPGTIASSTAPAVAFGPVAVTNNSTHTGTWSAVGNSASFPGGTTTVTRFGADAMNSNDIVIIDDVSDVIRASRYTTPNWGALGSTYSISGLTVPGVCVLSNGTIVVFKSNATSGLIALSHNGSTFSPVGNQLNVTGSNQGIALVALPTGNFILLDSQADTGQEYSFDGTDFAAVGSSFALGGVNGAIRGDALTSTRIIVADTSTHLAYLYEKSGGIWSAVVGGSFDMEVALGSATGTYFSVCGMNSTDVTVGDDVGRIQTMRWDAGSWGAVGNQYTVPNTSTNGTNTLVYLGGNEVSFMRATTTNGFLRRLIWQ